MPSINPFFEYVAEYRREHPDLRLQRVILSRASGEWKTLSESQKYRYRKQASDERNRRRRVAMAEMPTMLCQR
ncbi:uncharacterized protein Dsimw501_GD27797 [Drosophila simulans]|nr:uncharacterized protein Dsimw501_GD27797 [Drosophila simulans]